MQSGDMFIPEVLLSAKSMSEAAEILKPLLSEDEMKPLPKNLKGFIRPAVCPIFPMACLAESI